MAVVSGNNEIATQLIDAGAKLDLQDEVILPFQVVGVIVYYILILFSHRMD